MAFKLTLRCVMHIDIRREVARTGISASSDRKYAGAIVVVGHGVVVYRANIGTARHVVGASSIVCICSRNKVTRRGVGTADLQIYAPLKNCRERVVIERP